MASFRHILSAMLPLLAATAGAKEVGDSIDTYQNQTVSTEVFVQGRTTLTMSSVTVTPTGELTAKAPVKIVVNGPFDVQLGGTLNMNTGHQWRVIYCYDNSGNIIARHRN